MHNLLLKKMEKMQLARNTKGGKLHTAVVDLFEAAILDGEIAVGDQLPSEGEIAELFQISKRPVREAVQILETRGLIRRKHGERAVVVRDDVGKFVGTLAETVRNFFSQSTNYFVQLMEVRQIIEVTAVETLCTEGHGLAEEVTIALDRMKSAMEQGDEEQFSRYDADFHLGLIHSLQNDILNVFYDNLFGLIVDVIRVSSRIPRKPLSVAYAEHEEMYTLIKCKKAVDAKAVVKKHIDGSLQHIKTLLGS